jgi:hypothetical protein
MVLGLPIFFNININREANFLADAQGKEAANGEMNQHPPPATELV